MSRRLLVAVVLVLAAAAGAGELAGPGSSPRAPVDRMSAASGRVVRVVDGDTIHVALGGGTEKVRYIGVDTPETGHPRTGVQCFGAAASELNARLVGGERVRLELDAEERDRYGRLLAYVYRARDGLLVNAELARRGYARPLAIAPNVRHAARFAALARQARASGRGLWARCAGRR